MHMKHELHKRSAGRYGNLFWNQQAAEEDTQIKKRVIKVIL